jgi:2,4-dienoyl-CoA reductase-like NADH-dependent reductase (Old Yellow Enzyme family)/thioredoxin reductase
MPVEVTIMAENKPFNYIYSKGKIGNLTARNRIVLPAMGTNLPNENGFVTDRLIEYHRIRAMGGIGIDIVELACVDTPLGKVNRRQLSIDHDKYISGLRQLSRAIQDRGAKAILQIHHAGGIARSVWAGDRPVSSSPVQVMPMAEISRELTTGEIKKLTSCFANAVQRAQEAGFDGVEIHSAHIYLLQQFLSRSINRRQDQYGGILENRARFLLEVILAARKLMGKKYTIWCRINGEETRGGFSVEEAVQTAKWAVEAGVNAINVSGTPSVRSPLSPSGWGLHNAEEIKKALKVPVIAVGRLSIEMGNEAIKNGQADFIALGRPLIADPSLPRKTSEKHFQDVTPCIYCNRCIDEFIAQERNIECSVNALAGNELACKIEPAIIKKNVVVVGGGIAGLEAARVAALRGHHVIIYEKTGRLGGQVLLAAKIPYKKVLNQLLDYYLRQLDRLSITANLNTEVTPGLINQIHPDSIILATGSIAIKPAISGIDNKNVSMAEDVISGLVITGQKVVVIGGGIVGCETAYILSRENRNITIAEMLKDAALEMPPMMRMELLHLLHEKGVNIVTNTRVSQICDTAIVATDAEGNIKTIEVDSVVIAAGAFSNNKLEESLKGKAKELFVIGDAKKPRRIKEAIYDGFNAALTI